MPNSAKINFSETDLTFSPNSGQRGIAVLIGTTKRGPVAEPRLLVTSWEHFQRIYGGLMDDNDFPLICKRALDGGASLRVVNVRHYTDATDASTLTALKAELSNSFEYDISALNLGSGDELRFKIGATEVDQLYTTSASNTLALLVNQIKTTFAAETYYVASAGNILTFVPKIDLASDPAVHIVESNVEGAAAAKTVKIPFRTTAGNTTFTLAPKYPGADYNNMVVTISNASNGSASHFNLTIEMVGEPGLTEVYKNLSILGKPNAANSTYLDGVKNSSALVDVIYQDTASVESYARPANGTYKAVNGSNGGTVVSADKIGSSSSKVGIYALDSIDDAMQFGIPDETDVAVHTAAASYASSRADMVYFAEINKSNETVNDIVSARAAMNINDSYTAIYSAPGGLLIADPRNGTDKYISPMGDLMAIAAMSDIKFGEWYSFAGQRRGIVKNALGVKANFGNSVNDMDYLANNQINVIISKYGNVMLSGNFTAQLTTSVKSFLNVRRLNITIKRALAPILNLFIEEPNDPETWKQIYSSVTPYLEGLESKRALYDHSWQGDQFAKADLSNLVINNPADVQLGKYKARLYAKEIVSLQEFGLEIVITPSGVSFEEVI